MAYTCSVSAVSGGKTTVSGTGYVANTRYQVAVTFSSTDGKRKTLELYRVTTDVSGAFSYSLPVPFASGTYTVKALDEASAPTVLQTASNLSV